VLRDPIEVTYDSYQIK